MKKAASAKNKKERIGLQDEGGNNKTKPVVVTLHTQKVFNIVLFLAGHGPDRTTLVACCERAAISKVPSTTSRNPEALEGLNSVDFRWTTRGL